MGHWPLAIANFAFVILLVLLEGHEIERCLVSRLREKLRLRHHGISHLSFHLNARLTL